MKFLLKASQVVEGCPEEILLESGHVLIGELPVNHLRLPGVEGIHAMVEMDEQVGTVKLFDMGSESGLKLNGELVEVAEHLQAGDVIEIGVHRIQVLDGGGGEAKASPPPPPLPHVPEDPSDLKFDPPEAPSLAKPSKKSASLETTIELGDTPSFELTVEGEAKKRGAGPKVQREEAPEEKPRTFQEGPSDYDRARQDKIAPKRVVARSSSPGLFSPGKARPGGSVLEVVAFWGASILDVRHYGGKQQAGEALRDTKVVLGDEAKGAMIGVMDSGKVLPNVTLAQTKAGQVSVKLQKGMRARVKRSSGFEKIDKPSSFSFSSREFALIKSGPINYFLMHTSLPPSRFPKFTDPERHPILFGLFLSVYLVFSGFFWKEAQNFSPKKAEEDIWSTVLAFEKVVKKPKPKVLPSPKKPVKLERPKKLKKLEPPPKPKPLKELSKPAEKQKKLPAPKPQKKPKKVAKPMKSLSKPQPPRPPQKSGTPRSDRPKPARDKSLSPKLSKPRPGNGGGARGGTKSPRFSGARKGNQSKSAMGVSGGKPNIPSGINLAKLGVGMGRVSDQKGLAAVKVGAQSSAGGGGAGAGSSAKKAYGFGGLGSQSSLATGGPARALSGLGGGAGGLGGSGGRGGRGGSGSGNSPMGVSRISIPPGDPVLEGNALSRHEIEAVIRANLGQIRACYERNLQTNRGLSGRVQTQFVIGGNGRVSSSSVVSSSLNHGPTESCILSAIRRWKFPLPAGGASVQVKYPFVLRSN